MNPITTKFTYGDKEVTFETNRIAKQATASVVATMGDTVVLCTLVAQKEAKEGQDFFPLSVNYYEKAYATGKIPGGYLKREGRPSDRETLISRLIDRPLRPLFPQGFMQEVQIICQVISAEKEFEADILALLASSAAVAISGVPFEAPIAGARVGFTKEAGYILNPSYEVLETSLLDMVVAGTKDAVLMVESEAKELTEDQMLGAVLFAQQEMQVAISAIEDFVAKAGKEKWDWQPEPKDEDLIAKVKDLVLEKVTGAYEITHKQSRYSKLDEIKQEAIDALETDDLPAAEITKVFGDLEKTLVRENVIAGKPRIDGRDYTSVRPIEIEVGVLPRVHGSALFTRGETQALVVATLGTSKDEQYVETLAGELKEHFLFHYNFPPFSVGEVGFIGSPKRREIGHGNLAKRGVQAMMPNKEDFPYTIRVVSEITESNGSSSMASVCGSSLALMDAGVPVKAPVAGIAMGLVKEGENYRVLTDILGDEDHLGDMDFKVAGTKEGITALQMDIKISGITEQIMEEALNQALAARLHILDKMNQVLSESRSELSENAPVMLTMKIDSEKIRDVIGKGGATIRGITEETGASIDIEDDGSIKIYAEDAKAANATKAIIEGITAEAEIGKVYKGKVSKIADFGAFVTFLPGQDGLVHISQIDQARVENVKDYLSEGEEVAVKVIDIDNRNRVKLSIKEVTEAEKNELFS